LVKAIINQRNEAVLTANYCKSSHGLLDEYRTAPNSRNHLTKKVPTPRTTTELKLAWDFVSGQY